MCANFMQRTPATQGNTHTDGNTLYLHDNAIARHTADGIEISMAGWETVTTRERLNGLPGVSISQRAGVQYLNGKAWHDSHVWTNPATYANS